VHLSNAGYIRRWEDLFLRLNFDNIAKQDIKMPWRAKAYTQTNKDPLLINRGLSTASYDDAIDTYNDDDAQYGALYIHNENHKQVVRLLTIQQRLPNRQP